MKSITPLLFVASCCYAVSPTSDISSFPIVRLEGWGGISMPVPPGYEAACFKGENHFVFSLAKPGQSPVLEIYNGFEPPAAEEGEKCYAEIAGKRYRGRIVPQPEGGDVHEYLLEDGPAGSAYLFTLHGGPDVAVMQEVMGSLRFETAPDAVEKTTRVFSAEPPPAAFENRTFRCKGAFSLPVPADWRVVESRDGDAYWFHFLDSKGRRVLSIYCGYAPAVQTGGEAAYAHIAGQKRDGNLLSGNAEPSSALMPNAPGKVSGGGEEYVLPGGAEGALYHLQVFDSPQRETVLKMLETLTFAGGSALPEAAQQQCTALRESAESCVRSANIILSKVHDRAGADAAARELRSLADVMQANDRAAAALQQRYGRALHAYLHAPDKPNTELSPTTKLRKSEPENEIQRVHEADCYGSEALEQLLLRFMGVEND